MSGIFDEDASDKEEDVFGEDKVRSPATKRKGLAEDPSGSKGDDNNSKKAKKPFPSDDDKITKFHNNNKSKQKEKSQSITGIIGSAIYLAYPMFISFMQGIRFFQKIVESQESTFPEVNLVFDEKGISVFAIDNSNIAIVSIIVPKNSGCFDIYHCPKRFTLKVITKVFASKFKKPERYSSVSFIFANPKDLNTLTIAMIDVVTNLIDCTDLNGDSTAFNETEEISKQKITIPRPIEFSTKFLAECIFDKFKDVSKMVLIGCDYSKFHICSSGESKNYLGPAKKRIVLPLIKMKKKETDPSKPNDDYVFVPDVQSDGGISSTQVKQLNEMFSNILQKSGDYESPEKMKKILEFDGDKQPPCAQYILEYITSMIKINELSDKVTVGFNKDGVIVFRFSLPIGEMTYALSAIVE